MKIDGSGFQSHPPGLYFREVKNIVDDGEEGVATASNRLQQLFGVFFIGVVFEKFGDAYNGIERRPDLMAHICKEEALCHIGRLGTESGFLEFQIEHAELVEIIKSLLDTPVNHSRHDARDQEKSGKQ